MQSLFDLDSADSPPPANHRARRRVSPLLVLPSLAGALLLIAGATAVVVLARQQPGDQKSAAPADTAAPIPTGRCPYVPSTDAPGGQRATAPDPNPTLPDHPHARLTTNHGTIEIDLAADAAPCTVNSFLSLAHGGFYTGTRCHRLTTAPIFVLQCGDPSGTGQGGPGYRYGDENLPVGRKFPYPRGTLAMANGGPGTNGSQFFLVYQDSDIDPNYSVFGTVTGGLDVLDAIAAGGSDDSNAPGDGRPKVDVTISQVG